MYKNEAILGDTMKLYYGEKDDAIFITMKNSIDDKLHCIVKLYWYQLNLEEVLLFK